jgi:lysophospholipase L1-like esterase
MRFLALGDSYTIGEAVAPEERWPVLLAALLRAEGLDVDEPVIIARTGWTTDELNAGIDQAAPEGTYDLVSLLIGVNNQYRRRSLDQYRQQFVGLLERAIAFAGGDASRVLVLSIPDWGVTPFAGGQDRQRIAGDIDRFNLANQEEAARLGARYIDVTPSSRQAASDRSLLASDGLHPSGRMYAQWAALALPAALEALQHSPGETP